MREGGGPKGNEETLIEDRKESKEVIFEDWGEKGLIINYYQNNELDHWL